MLGQPAHEPMSEHEDPAINRILVALDASTHSVAALRAAAELAGSLQAELHGLFVEDANLLRAAELPMARELRFPFASHARMNPATMRHQLQAQAYQARRALSSLCQQQHLKWTFQVVQGKVSSAVLEAAGRADLLCVGRASRPVLGKPRLGSTARAAAMASERSVLLVSHGMRLQAPVTLPFDGSPEADRALPLACRLARLVGGSLSAILLTDRSRPSHELQDSIIERLECQSLAIRYRERANLDIAALIEDLQTEGCGLLILSRALIRRDDITQLLDQLRCPTILVR